MRIAVMTALACAVMAFPVAADDQERVAVTKPKPIGSPKFLDRIAENPTRSMRDFEGGTVKVAVAIEPDGSPSYCQLTQSSGLSEIDVMVCPGVMKMKFRPAVDADGVPLRAVWFGSFYVGTS